MAKYHINPKTGRPNLCNPEKTSVCAYAKDGENPPHYENKEDAKIAYEETGKKEFGATSTLKSKKSKMREYSLEELSERGNIDGIFANFSNDSIIQLEERIEEKIAEHIKKYDEKLANPALEAYNKALIAEQSKDDLADLILVKSWLRDRGIETEKAKQIAFEEYDFSQHENDPTFITVDLEKYENKRRGEYILKEDYVKYASTASFLKNYENWTDSKDRSNATLSMYKNMRNISVISDNNAMALKKLMEDKGLKIPHVENKISDEADPDVSYSKSFYNNQYYLEQGILYDHEIDEDYIENVAEYAKNLQVAEHGYNKGYGYSREDHFYDD